MSIPRSRDDLTPEWFSKALNRTVAEVATEPIGVGVGLVGQLYRCELTTSTEPITVIAKLAALGDESRFVATILNMYGREIGFYTDCAPLAGALAPDCYFTDHDPETQDAVLLLEDVSTRGMQHDQVVGCSPLEAAPAIHALAKFHAQSWDQELVAGDWLKRLCDDPFPGASQFAYVGAWPRAQELFPDAITPEVQALGDAFGDRVPALFAKLCEGPLVLSHADWRLDNLFFTPAGDIVAVDWQLVDRSVGPRDLSYFVTQSMETDGLADCIAAFETYTAALDGHGIDVDRDWAWEMYRYGAQFSFIYPIVAAGGLTVEDPRHLALTRGMLERSIRAIAALDAFELPL